MTEHIYTKSMNSITSSSLRPVNFINSIRIPQLEKTFINKTNGQKFIKNEVQIMKYKRNKLITTFFKRYLSNSEFTMLEIGVDFNSTQRIGDILLKLKRQLKRIDLIILSYCWLIDRGEYGNMHFHLVVATERIDIKGKKLPIELKLTFKGKKIHNSFVSNKPKLMNYLLKKEIYFIGKRKRVYGKSRKFL